VLSIPVAARSEGLPVCYSSKTTTQFYTFHSDNLLIKPITFLGFESLDRKYFHGIILENICLNLINENSKGVHGYGLQKSIKRNFGVVLGASTIYPELKRLERQGLIDSIWCVSMGRAKRQYRLTNKGRKLMAKNSLDLKTIVNTSCIEPLICNSNTE